MAKRWVNRPEGSNWGDFGDDDQLGRINLLTADRVRQAADEIRTGKNFCLSLPLDYPGGNVLNARRYPPNLSPTELNGEQWMNMSMGEHIRGATDVICDDQVLICLQYSTQWDSLAHVGSHFDADGDGEAEKVFYNGYRAGEHILGSDDHVQPGALNLSIDNFASNPIQGRGVLVDLYRHFIFFEKDGYHEWETNSVKQQRRVRQRQQSIAQIVIRVALLFGCGHHEVFSCGRGRWLTIPNFERGACNHEI